MRKRVDRGTVRTVKRDGVRRIPRAELERVGLWPGSQPELAAGQELATLRAQLAEAHRELADLRPLPAQLEAERQAREIAEVAMYQQRAEASTAVARLQSVEQQRETAAAALQPLTDGGLISGVRALLSLRRTSADDDTGRAGDPTPAAA
jgi:chromosome segregation ATPase